MKTIITSLLFSISLLVAAQSVEVKGSITIKTIKQQKDGKIDTVLTKGGRTMIILFNKVDSRLISVAEDNGDYFFNIDLSKTPYTHIQFENIESGIISYPLKDIKFPFYDIEIVKIDGAIIENNVKSGFKVDTKKKDKNDLAAPPVIPSKPEKEKKKTKKAKEEKPADNSNVEPEVAPLKEAEQTVEPQVKQAEPEKTAEPIENVKEDVVAPIAPQLIEELEAPKALEKPEVKTKEVVPAANQLLPEEETVEEPKSKKELKAAEKEAKLLREIQELEESIKKAETEEQTQP